MPVTIHFLNVGHGDCSVIEHASGRLSVIDINNANVFDVSSLIEIAQELQISSAGDHALLWLATLVIEENSLIQSNFS